MHRTQIMLEEGQDQRLKAESASTGRSIADLVRDAVDEKYSRDQARMWKALRASRGAWADRDDIGTGAEYVERIRSESLNDRLARYGWE
jgi:hypothetical protein